MSDLEAFTPEAAAFSPAASPAGASSCDCLAFCVSALRSALVIVDFGSLAGAWPASPAGVLLPLASALTSARDFGAEAASWANAPCANRATAAAASTVSAFFIFISISWSI